MTIKHGAHGPTLFRTSNNLVISLKSILFITDVDEDNPNLFYVRLSGTQYSTELPASDREPLIKALRTFNECH